MLQWIGQQKQKEEEETPAKLRCVGLEANVINGGRVLDPKWSVGSSEISCSLMRDSAKHSSWVMAAIVARSMPVYGFFYRVQGGSYSYRFSEGLS